jgi:AcrR family transcriptional regulator
VAKEALDKIDARKRERIFRNAAAEFARHGYHKANINSIARRAGIGKGSIYLYFSDKRDLYYSTFKEAIRIQNEIFDLIERLDLDPIAKIEKVFEESVSAIPRYQHMFKMYFDLGTSGNEKSLAELAQLLEGRSAEFFIRVLTDGIASGRIRSDLPVRHAAYVIDSVYSIFFATLASRYQKERFRVFTDDAISWNGDLVKHHVRGVLDVLENGIISKGIRGTAGRKRPFQGKGSGNAPSAGEV